MTFLKLLVELAGGSTTMMGAVLIGAGLTELLPFMGISEKLAHGAVWTIMGIGVIVVPKMWAKSEAEKRIHDPALPSSSSVPIIQNQIETIKRETK